MAVVSESFAKQSFPGEEALGRRFWFAFEQRMSSASSATFACGGSSGRASRRSTFPIGQMDDDSLPWFIPKDLVVRASIEPSSLLPAIREIVARADPQIPVSDVRTLSDIVGADTRRGGSRPACS